jgi:hypothetical protein
MDENLVGYLLNALDPDTEREVEAHVRAHPELQARLERLRAALAPLEADREPPAPPPGLVFRTLGRVAEMHAHDLANRADKPDEEEAASGFRETVPGPSAWESLPAAPPIVPMQRDLAPRSWWRRADVLVAAGLLIAVLTLAIPRLQTMREGEQVEACKFNLHGYHQRLVDYSQRHEGQFPDIAAQPYPRNVAGMFVPLFSEVDSGEAAPVSVRCPGNGGHLPPRWSLKELEALPEDEFNRRAPHLVSCYAYTLGYQDEKGRHHGLRRQSNEHLPIVADGPPPDDRGNSPNHGGKGQNILYVGGHVRFLTAPTGGIDGDHIYLNHHHQPRAGRHPHDSVLGASDDRP